MVAGAVVIGMKWGCEWGGNWNEWGGVGTGMRCRCEWGGVERGYLVELGGWRVGGSGVGSGFERGVGWGDE